VQGWADPALEVHRVGPVAPLPGRSSSR